MMHLRMKAAMYIIMMQLLWCEAMCANEISFFSWVESMQAAYINTFYKTSYSVEMMTGVVIHTGYQGAVQFCNQWWRCFWPKICRPNLSCCAWKKWSLNVSCLIKHFYCDIFYSVFIEIYKLQKDINKIVFSEQKVIRIQMAG